MAWVLKIKTLEHARFCTKYLERCFTLKIYHIIVYYRKLIKTKKVSKKLVIGPGVRTALRFSSRKLLICCPGPKTGSFTKLKVAFCKQLTGNNLNKRHKILLSKHKIQF